MVTDMQGYEDGQMGVSNGPLKEGRASQGESAHFSSTGAVGGPGGRRETHST